MCLQELADTDQIPWPAHVLRLEQRTRYRGRNFVERCFNKLKRRVATLSDKTDRDYYAGICLAATVHWLDSFRNTS